MIVRLSNWEIKNSVNALLCVCCIYSILVNLTNFCQAIWYQAIVISWAYSKFYLMIARTINLLLIVKHEYSILKLWVVNNSWKTVRKFTINKEQDKKSAFVANGILFLEEEAGVNETKLRFCLNKGCITFITSQSNNETPLGEVKLDLWWWWIVFHYHRDNCQRFSPSQTSEKPRPGFEPAHNLSLSFIKLNCAVVITTTPRHH